MNKKYVISQELRNSFLHEYKHAIWSKLKISLSVGYFWNMPENCI